MREEEKEERLIFTHAQWLSLEDGNQFHLPLSFSYRSPHSTCSASPSKPPSHQLRPWPRPLFPPSLVFAFWFPAYWGAQGKTWGCFRRPPFPPQGPAVCLSGRSGQFPAALILSQWRGLCGQGSSCSAHRPSTLQFLQIRRKAGSGP